MIEIKSFIGAVLHRSEKDTIKAALEEAVALRANLRRANLGGANLGGAYLGDANLGGANLGGAYLGDANLRGADLRGANLGGAYLGDATIIEGGHILTGHALGYSWWAAPTDKGVLLHYGYEQGTPAEWRENAKAWAERHESDRADQFERFTLALLAMVEVAFAEIPVAEPKGD